MKLTSVKDKIEDSINDSIRYKCFYKTYGSIPDNIYLKIDNEIWTSSFESIGRTRIRILNNLQNEIN